MSQASMSAVYLRASLNTHCSMGGMIERFLYWPCDSGFLNNKYIFFNSVEVDDPSASCPDLRGKSPMRRIYVQSKGDHQILFCRMFAQRADGYPQFCNLFFLAKKSATRQVLYTPSAAFLDQKISYFEPFLIHLYLKPFLVQFQFVQTHCPACSLLGEFLKFCNISFDRIPNT